MTIHYNKLQADPKQGKSLDIGKTGFFLLIVLKLHGWVKDWSKLKPESNFGSILPLKSVIFKWMLSKRITGLEKNPCLAS